MLQYKSQSKLVFNHLRSQLRKHNVTQSSESQLGMENQNNFL